VLPRQAHSGEFANFIVRPRSITKWDAYLKEFVVGQAWQTDSLQSFMMQPASIYKALLTFQNTATDLLVGHLKHFCLSKTCLPMALVLF
jgi:hypothetical protein